MNLLDPIISPLAEPAWRSRRARVRVGVSPALALDEEEDDRRAVCVLGIIPPGGPPPSWVCAALGAALRRSSRLSEGGAEDEDTTVALFRLRGVDRAGILPGLDMSPPSLVRDTVEVALRAGSGAVELLLLWPGRGLTPWSPSSLAAILPFLEQLPGALLLIPDLLGAAGGVDTFEAQLRAHAVITTLRPIFSQQFQTALLDLPTPWGSADCDVLLRPLLGADAVVCAWEGSARGLARHGWRSAAAVLAGALAARGAGRGMSVRGLATALPEGRYAPDDRGERLGQRPPVSPRLDEELPIVRVLPQQGADGAWSGRVLSEPTLRRPIGGWPVPALLEIKEVHRLVMAAASRFVFETVDEEQSMALGVALRRALRRHIDEGMLVGADGTGAPEVRAYTRPNPAEPGLSVSISAMLRPWALQLNLRLAVRANHPPALEGV